jgi:hypothetical protein
MTDNRVSRGRKTQVITADYLKPVFPDAKSLAASLPGKDIENTEGWACEVKARREFKPTTWADQMAKRDRDDEWSFCVMRPDGYGPERVNKWLTFMLFEDMRALIGYIQNLEAKVARYEVPAVQPPAPPGP